MVATTEPKAVKNHLARGWRGPRKPLFNYVEAINRDPDKQALLSLCDCANCPINLYHRFNPVFGQGAVDADLAFVGEAPGADEDSTHVPFVGASGRLLDRILEDAGTSRERVYATNTVLCRPGPNNEKPPDDAVRCCRPRLEHELRNTRPQVIVPLGSAAMKTLLGTSKSITSMNGVTEWSDELGAYIMPTFHPAAGLRGNQQYLLATKDVINRAVKIAQGGEITKRPEPEKFEYRHVSRDKQNEEYPYEAMAHLTDLMEGEHGCTLAFDIETAGFDQTKDVILQIAIANEQIAIVFDFEALWGDAWNLMLDLIMSPKHTWLMHNASFDLQFLIRDFELTFEDLEQIQVKDTLCYAYAIEEQAGSSGLKALARKYFNAGDYEEVLRQYAPTKDSSYALIPRPVLAEYAAKDVIYTARMYPLLRAECEAEGVLEVVENLTLKAQIAFASMERDGIKVDLGVVNDLRKEWLPRIEELRREAQAVAQKYGFDARRVVKNAKGPDLNPGSSTHLKWLLYDERMMNLEVPEANYQAKQRAAAKGEIAYPTGKEFREAYWDSENEDARELARILGQFSMARKMMTTYVEGIADDIRPATGRIHPSFHIAGTTTGRLTITDPPLQTIPRETTTGKGGFQSVKRLFVPSRSDHVILEADHGQLEFRMGWLLSGDRGMGEAILSGDFHRATAVRIFNTPWDEVTEDQRHNTKYVTFGVMYGRGAYSLEMGELKGTGYNAEQFIRDWFEAFPAYHAWWQRTRLKAIKNGRLVSLTGRVRRWPMIDREQMLRSVLGGYVSREAKELMNQAANFPNQSLASDFTLMAMILLDKVFRKRGWGRALFTVHDAILFEIAKQYVERAAHLVKIVMESPKSLVRLFGFDTDVSNAWIWPDKFALEADPKVGPSWGETKTFVGYDSDYARDLFTELLEDLGYGS